MAFDLKDMTLTQHGKELPIIKWEVWFMTPFGVFQNSESAINRMIQADIDPGTVLIPVPVAIDSQDRYEIIVRR